MEQNPSVRQVLQLESSAQLIPILVQSFLSAVFQSIQLKEAAYLCEKSNANSDLVQMFT